MSSANSSPTNGAAAPPPPDLSIDLWDASSNSSHSIALVVRHPWQWVIDNVKNDNMMDYSSPKELPSSMLCLTPSPSAGELTPATPMTRRRRTRSKVHRDLLPATLRLEVLDAETGIVKLAAHGTSAALDGLEDKDELLRTVQRCRCEDLNLTPPSILLNWDVTFDECLNVVGQDLPALRENKSQTILAVLKEPMGSQGQGIFFVSTAEEIHKIVNDHRERALAEADLLDNLIAAKGRIPSWVLQAEVAPSLLIRGGRKFHIRTYLTVVEKLEHPDLLDVYIYNRHEVRVAGVPVAESATTRDKRAHITNGALSSSTERLLLHNVQELTKLNLQEKVEVFVAEIFAKHLFQDIARRVSMNSQNETGLTCLRKFAIAGLDIMVTEEGRLFLLEANVNPAAPPEHTITADFEEHLTGFMKDLMNLVVGSPSPNFLYADDILIQRGLLE